MLFFFAVSTIFWLLLLAAAAAQSPNGAVVKPSSNSSAPSVADFVRWEKCDDSGELVLTNTTDSKRHQLFDSTAVCPCNKILFYFVWLFWYIHFAHILLLFGVDCISTFVYINTVFCCNFVSFLKLVVNLLLVKKLCIKKFVYILFLFLFKMKL